MIPDSPYSARWPPAESNGYEQSDQATWLLVPQSVVQGPAAKILSGSLLEVQNLRPSLHPMEQNLHSNKISWWLTCTEGSRRTDLAAGFQGSFPPWLHIRSFRTHRDRAFLVSIIAGQESRWQVESISHSSQVWSMWEAQQRGFAMPGFLSLASRKGDRRGKLKGIGRKSKNDKPVDYFF